jgi:hypothetical protein
MIKHLIEKNIPIPEEFPDKYGFSELEVGDRRRYQREEIDSIAFYNRIKACAHQHAKHHIPKKFIIRKLTQDEVAVWRIQ